MKHSPLSIAGRPRLNSPLKKLLLILTLLTSHVFAQQRPIVRYTVREGLVQNQVLSLLKDSRGYVWCGTWYGLSRFNGETFENYTETEGLWNAEVGQIVEDKDGRIWVMGGNRLARFDGKTFKKITVPTKNPNSLILVKSDPLQILEGATGTMWEAKGDTLLPVELPNFPEKIQGIQYHAASDTYYLMVDQRIVSYHKGRLLPITEKGDWQLREVIHDEVHVYKRLSDGRHERYVLKNGKLVPYLILTDKAFTVLEPLNYSYVFDHQKVLYYLPPNSLEAERIDVSPTEMYGRGYLNQTTSSMLWIPTEKGLWGLALTGFKNFQDGEVPYAWSVVEDHRGDFLFMSYGNGIQKYDGKRLHTVPKQEYHSAAIESYKKIGLPAGTDYWYFRALRDQKGYCWIPEAHGLYRYKDDEWNFVRKSRNGFAFSAAEDKTRQKIVCASSEHFWTADIDPPFRTDSIRGTSPLFSGLIFCVAVAPAGDYWLSGRGIERYDPDSKKFSSYTIENGKLPEKFERVAVLYHDWSGTLWAGAIGKLGRYVPEKDRFEKVFDFKFQGLIGLVEQIDTDHLMISDIKNLYVLNLKKFNATGEVEIKTFNHHNGFMGMEPGQLGSYRDSKGRIWITSSSVLSVLDPKQLDLSTRPLRTMISKVNQQGVSFIHPDELVEVPEGESIINIKVETLGDDKPYNSQFSYLLEGEMRGWTEWQEQPIITLNNLPNGVHTLKVRSRSGDFNAHAASIATLRFRTKVVMWKSPDFYKYASLVGLLLVVALTLLWRRDARKGRTLLAQQSQLEKRERTLRLLQAQTIQSQMNPHFTSNVLSAIQRQILDMEAERASDNLVKMSRLSRAYLDDSLLDKNQESFSTKDISLTREIKLLKMYVDLQQLHYADRFDFALEISPELDTNSYRLPPFLIQPFVENAIVHGLGHRRERGLLQIKFQALPDEGLLCRIQDDGVGREAARLIQNKELREFTSVSTNLSQQRAALLNQLGYDIAIEVTDLDQGTAVEIQVGYK